MNALETWLANRSDAMDGLERVEESMDRGLDVSDVNDNEEAIELLEQALRVGFEAARAFLNQGKPA